MIEALRPLPKMRGIKEAVKEIKDADSGTALTEHALRRLIISGEVPSVRAGSKYLVNMQTLFDYLYKGTQTKEKPNKSGIRAVKE